MATNQQNDERYGYRQPQGPPMPQPQPNLAMQAAANRLREIMRARGLQSGQMQLTGQQYDQRLAESFNHLKREMELNNSISQNWDPAAIFKAATGAELSGALHNRPNPGSFQQYAPEYTYQQSPMDYLISQGYNPFGQMFSPDQATPWEY